MAAVWIMSLLSLAAEPAAVLVAPDDMEFLAVMARDTLEASRVPAGASVAGVGPNTTGGTVIRPGGRNAYPAFWIRDYAMSLDCGLVPEGEQRHALFLTARHQVDGAITLPTGSTLPPGSIPDHISFGGVPIFFPGILQEYDKQGGEKWGMLPCLDDQFFFIHMAWWYERTVGGAEFLGEAVNGIPLIERLERAWAMPPSEPDSGIVMVDDRNRGVNFGFFDTVVHTGKLFFASVLKYRAALELADLEEKAGRTAQAAEYREKAAALKAALPGVFVLENGWCRASTGRSGQPDVWGTAYAVVADALPEPHKAKASRVLADALRAGTIALRGNIRHVPTDADFSGESAWETCYAAKNTYQNGAYWGTATGWVFLAVRDTAPELAAALARDYVQELRDGDFRRDEKHGSPWECFHPDGNHRQNPVYLASVSVPLAMFQQGVK